MLRIPILLGFLFLSSAAPASTTLLQALKAKEVTLTAVKNEKSYHGQGLDLHIRNNTAHALSITIDPALIFLPDDTNCQNLVIISNETVALEPNIEKAVTVQCFCAKSYGAAPPTAMQFTYWMQGNDIMVQVLRYIINHSVNTSTAQDAVWVLTNNHPLSDIYNGDTTSEEGRLAIFMARLLHQQLPNYFTTHEVSETPGQVVYNPKPLKISASFDYITKTDQVLTLGVYKEDGTVVESVFENKQFGKGGHRFKIDFECADVPAGKYYIRLLSEGNILKEQEVKIE